MLTIISKDGANSPQETKILPEDGSPDPISEDPAAQAFQIPEPEPPVEPVEPEWHCDEEVETPDPTAIPDSPETPDTAATEAPDAELLQSLDLKLDAMRKDLSRLCLRIDNKIMIDEIRDKTITDLSSELKILRENQLFRAMKPLINGVIDVADDMAEIIRTLKEGDEAQRLLQYFHTMLHDALAIVDVNPYNSECAPYDPARHSIVTTQSTPDPALDKMTVRSVLTGYIYNDVVMRKEKVAVYKYEAPVEESSSGATEQQSDQIL